MKTKIIIASALIIIMTLSVLYFFTNEEPAYTLLPRAKDTNISSEFQNAQRAVNYYNAQIKKEPGNVNNYIQLAQIFLQEARISGSSKYISNANQIIEKALHYDSGNFDALVTKASISMNFHHFQTAKEIISKAIQKNSYNADAYGILCDANVELGLYYEAAKACDKMLSLRPDLRSYSRASYIREVNGMVPEAIDAMKLAADAGVFGFENRAWCLYHLGNLFLNSGKIDTAGFIFNGILEERPNYPFALSGLSKVHAAKEDFDKSIKYITRAYNSLPEHEFLEQLADLYKITNHESEYKNCLRQVIQLFEEEQRNGWNVNLEYAEFCADHEINLDEALNRIELEYKSRPNNINVLDTYAWVLHKKGKSANAIPYIEKAMKFNSKNPAFLFHAGIIYQGAGFSDKSILYLQEVINLNPLFDKIYFTDCSNRISLQTQIVSK